MTPHSPALENVFPLFFPAVHVHVVGPDAGVVHVAPATGLAQTSYVLQQLMVHGFSVPPPKQVPPKRFMPFVHRAAAGNAELDTAFPHLSAAFPTSALAHDDPHTAVVLCSR
jgi:hypothetical protein